MNKRIIIGSVLVLTLLLLMPSNHAVQIKIIEDRTYNDLIGQLDTKNEKEKNGLDDEIRYPILNVLVLSMLKFRLLRCFLLGAISTEPDPPWFDVLHPILFLRSIWLIITWQLLYTFWDSISDIFGWNWELEL